MAKEEIKLVGSFKDDITPSLKKLNRELGNIARSFERFNKKIAPVTKSFAKMAMSARTFSDAMQGQRRAIETSSRAMAEYSRQAGKMGSAMRKVQEQRMKAQRQMGVTRAQARKGMGGGGMPIPAAGGGKARGMAAATGKGMGMSFAQTVGASGLGIMLGQSMMGVVGAGVRGMTGLAMKPVNYMLDKFKDRAQDEMADLKSAGGLYAIDMEAAQKSGQKQLFNSVTDALQFQERLNIDAAKSAASLPGVTQQYVDVKRQLTDTVQMIMEMGKGEGKGEESRAAFTEFGESLGADVSAGGDVALKEAFSKVLGDLTERTVLIGQGQQGGLPMHIFMQELLNKQINNKGELGIAAMTKKYRAAFKTNPMLKKFLNEAESELVKTSAGSVERLQMVNEILAKAMPAEVVAKMRGTINGMTEAFNSAFFDQQSGLFGLSRPVENMAGGTNKIKRAVNDFSEVLFEVGSDITYETKDGQQKFTKGMRVSAEQLTRLGINFEKFGDSIKVNGEALEKAMDQSYLFEVIRETLSGFGVGTLQLAGLIPQIYDPFFDAVQALMPVRDIAQAFNKDVVATAKYFENVADQMKAKGTAEAIGAANVLRKQALLRGSISTFADTLADFGAISKETQDAINAIAAPKDLMNMTGKQLEEQNLAKALPMIFQGIMETDLVRRQIPEAVGQMIGSLVKAAGDFIIGMFSGFTEQGGFMQDILANMEAGFFEAFGGGDAGREAFGQMIARVSDIASDLLGQALEAALKVLVPAIGEIIKVLIKSIWDKGGVIGKAMVIAVPAALASLVLSITGAATAIKFATAQFAAGGMMAKGGAGRKLLAKAAAQNQKALAGVAGGGLAKKGAGAFAKAQKSLGTILKTAAKTKAGNKIIGALASFMVDASVMTSKMGGSTGGKMLKSVGGLAKKIPGLNVAFAALDATTRKLSGQSTFKALSGAGGGLVGSVIGGALGSFLGPIGTVLGSMLGGWLGSLIGDFIGDIDFGAIGGAIGDAWNNMMGFLGDVWSNLASAGTGIMEWVGDVWNNFMEFIGQEFAKFMDNPAMYLGEALGSMIRFFYIDLPRMIVEGFNAGIDFITQALMSAFESLKAGIQSAWDSLVAWIQSLPEQINAILEQIKAAITNAVEGLKGVFTDFVSTIQGIPAQIGPALGGIANAIINWAKELPGKVMGAIGSAGGNFLQGVKNTLFPKYNGNFPGARTAAKGSGNKGFTMTELSKATKGAARDTKNLTQTWVSVNQASQNGLATAAAGLSGAINGAAQKLSSAASSIGGGSDEKAKVAYNGGSGMMSLASAIATESRMKPPGSDLVIANSSETIIPAFNGHIGDQFKGLDFDTMEAAAGFNRMESYTEQLSELADKTAANFSGGFGGALGGGSATLNAMEALGHSFGLITTSGHRPGDPGFHGANRARDLSNGGGETPEMNAAAAKMASEFGSNLTELIYTPMGFSIKNGAKTGLISPDNHYHHIHVAVAEGLKKAAVFSSQQAAEAYEKRMMPAGAEPMKVNLASMTANSSEFGNGMGDVHIGSINVSGVDDPKQVADQVAEEILFALRRSSYSELNVS